MGIVENVIINQKIKLNSGHKECTVLVNFPKNKAYFLKYFC